MDSNLLAVTLTDTGQIIIKLNRDIIPFRYTVSELTDIHLIHSDLHLSLILSEALEGAGTSDLNRTRAIVLSEREWALVSATLKRREAQASDPSGSFLSAVIESITEQRK